jgi:hypothetical protein
MTARQREAEAKKKTKAPRKTIDKLSLSECSDYWKVDPYSVEHNSRVEDAHFSNHAQEEVYSRIYLPLKHKVVNQHHINVAYMCKNSEYFGEALAMCEEFGLLPLMQFVQNWDEELVVQFYSTIYFTEDVDKTIKWLTNGRLLETTWAEFGDSLGYTILDSSKDEDANGWRCHDSDYADHKDTMAPLYIRGHENLWKTSTLAPEYHILLCI